MMIRILFVLLLTMPVTDALSDAADIPADTLRFDVYLEGSRIGTHRYDFSVGESGITTVVSRAKFDVRFLFFNAYSYRHEAEERWSGDCLTDIEATTDANGKTSNVGGERTGDGFVVWRAEEREVLPACVMTFAYWNPDFLEQPKLLNPQTGEYLDVTVERLGRKTETIGGTEREVLRYRVVARDTDITVFYSPQDEWLALESLAKGGRKIRYEISS